MATFTGQLGAVLLGVNAVAEIRGFEITATSDILDDTVMGDTWKTNKATHKSWSGSMDVLYDHTNTLGQNALVIGASLTGSFYPSENLTAAAELTGTFRITEKSVKTTHEGMVEASISFTGNGALVEGVKA
jgi:hypothetical protein